MVKEGAIDTAFVRELCDAALLTKDGPVQLDTDEGPRTGRDKAKWGSKAGTAMTADAVSWEATAVKGTCVIQACFRDHIGEQAGQAVRRVGGPAGRDSGETPMFEISSASHPDPSTRSSWVVEALVSSAPRDPVSQYPRRSGMRSRVRARRTGHRRDRRQVERSC